MSGVRCFGEERETAREQQQKIIPQSSRPSVNFSLSLFLSGKDQWLELGRQPMQTPKADMLLHLIENERETWGSITMTTRITDINQKESSCCRCVRDWIWTDGASCNEGLNESESEKSLSCCHSDYRVLFTDSFCSLNRDEMKEEWGMGWWWRTWTCEQRVKEGRQREREKLQTGWRFGKNTSTHISDRGRHARGKRI